MSGFRLERVIRNRFDVDGVRQENALGDFTQRLRKLGQSIRRLSQRFAIHSQTLVHIPYSQGNAQYTAAASVEPTRSNRCALDSITIPTLGAMIYSTCAAISS